MDVSSILCDAAFNKSCMDQSGSIWRTGSVWDERQSINIEFDEMYLYYSRNLHSGEDEYISYYRA